MGKIMMNGIQYGVGGIEQAKDISYDNTESGATATDVQGALDELNAGLTGLTDYSNEVICGYLGSTPVYRTVLTGVSVPNGQITNLSSLGIVKVINLYGSAYNGSYWIGIPFYDSSSNKCTLLYNPTSKVLAGWTDKTYTNATIFIEYTKE